MGASSKLKQDYPKASDAMHYGGILSYIAGIFLIMAFAGPYWIQSQHDTISPFMNMGLWEYCFKELRFPNYPWRKEDLSSTHHPFQSGFYGCHYVFSETFDEIRDDILPGWLILVQAFVTLSLILSFSSQILSAITLMRWPLKFVLTHEWRLTGWCFVMNAVACSLLFASVCIFGGQCWRREFLTYPNYNYLSWSYGLAVVSFFFHGFAAYVLYFDARKQYARRSERQGLVAQMYPDPLQNGFV